MKLLFYLGHPAHFYNVSQVINRLQSAGHSIVFYARGKDVLFNIIDKLPFKIYRTKYIVSNNKIGFVFSVLKREYELFKICIKERPHILVGTDIVITHIGKLLGIPSLILNEDDARAVPLFAKYGIKYSTYTLSPDCCDISPYNDKKIGYCSYHELGYLHPNHFKPDQNIVKKYIDINLPYFILRFSNLKAHHDIGKKGILDNEAYELIKLLETKGIVYISSERKIRKDLEKYRIKIEPKDMHHILAQAKIFIGDSQTMSAEAGVLGTPFIRYNDFVGELGYLSELEKKYELGYGIKPPEFDEVLRLAKKMIETINIKKIWGKKRDIMLSEKIDFSQYLFWLLNEYPDSIRKIKEEPKYQFIFK